MRGISSGQKIHIFIIPEVKELISRETRNRPESETLADHDHTLENVVAWLVINSMRTEQMQWSMLQIQNSANLYRKNAFAKLLAGSGQGAAAEDDAAEELADDKPQPYTHAGALDLFKEPIDFRWESA